jgi:hypothetical protein
MSDSTVYSASNTFPYSSVGPPSTQFNTAQPCKDSRCDKCQTYDNADGNTVTGPDAARYVGNKVCDSCSLFVDPDLRAGKNAFLFCSLCTSTQANCAQCDSEIPARCMSCNDGFYLNKLTNTCGACSVDTNLASGCKRCDSGSCLECLNGYYKSYDSEKLGYVCKKCDLTEHNKNYVFQPDRCSQCEKTDATVCKYCDIGFLGSTSNPTQCVTKCDVGQFPEITYIPSQSGDYEDNEN